jgi:glyoxylase I family protein
MTTVQAVAHVGILVAEVERALIFYRDVLGLTVDDTRPDLGYPGAWLWVGRQQIHLMELSNPGPMQARSSHGGRDRHLALAVTELATIRHALERANVSYTLSRSGRRALFCRDPDGNALEFIEQR